MLSEVLPYLELNKDDEKEEDIRKQVEVSFDTCFDFVFRTFGVARC